MQLSIKHKFAFLCIPKCGSTSVEKAIRKHCEMRLNGHPSIKHMSASRFKRHVRPLLHKADPNDEVETFCIMREPFDCLRSWYTYRNRSEIADPKHPRHQRHTGGVSFKEFVEGFLEGNRPESAGIGSQANFVTLGNGSIGVDRIFRLDQMEAVADYLSKKIGKKIEIPVANKSLGVRIKSKPGAFDLPEPLMTRLMAHLEPDYAIYKSLPYVGPKR